MALLTTTGIITKTVDFTFRAYYSKHLGAEGMGIYSLIMSIFGIVLSLSSAGMGVAVSRLVSIREEQGNKTGAVSVVKTAVFMVFCVGAVCICIVLFFAEWISAVILKDVRCVPGLLCIAPASMFMGISYCIKGYFYGIRKVIIPAGSEFVEQAVKIISISIFLKQGLGFGVEYGCAGVLLGLTIGEMSSCLYLVIWYLVRTKGEKSEDVPVKSILNMTVPMTLSAVGNSFFRMVEDVWTIDGLEMSGEENAMEIYGLIRGMTMPLLVFPLNLISSFMALLVPEVSRAEENGKLKTIVRRVGKTGLLFGFMVFAVFYVFAEEISCTVYGTSAAAAYIKPLRALCPVMIIDSLSGGMLGGLGEQSTLLRYSIADTALRLAIIYFILPLKGTMVIIIMTFLSNFLTCGLNVQKIRKKAGEYILLKDIIKLAIYTVVAISLYQII